MDLMSRAHEPKQAEPIEKAQLLAVEDQLKTWLQRVQNSLEVLDAFGRKDIACYNWPTGKGALKPLGNFIKALDDSIQALKLGEPIQPGQLKPRSTYGKSKSGKETTLQAEVAARKKTPKKKGE